MVELAPERLFGMEMKKGRWIFVILGLLINLSLGSIYAASDEIVFLGAIYNKEIVRALRFHARLYVHGHQVGGTNPSLVESLGAGNAVLAHDNPYNRWVAGDGACYFKDDASCAVQLERILDDFVLLESMAVAGRIRHSQAFTWEQVLAEYEDLLIKWQCN